MARKPAISHAQMHKLGFERTDPKPWGKLDARWRNKEGWCIDHCGHPTALRPWAVYDPEGGMHCTGGQPQHGGNPSNGTAWPSLADAAWYIVYKLRNP